MSLIGHLHRCNNHNPGSFIPFRVDNIEVGRVRPAFARRLSSWPEVFRVTVDGVDLCIDTRKMAQRSAAVAGVLAELVDQGVLTHLQNEPYIVTPGSRDEGVFLIDRAAASLFGIKTFGQHLNGYVKRGSDLLMWVGRRAMDRRLFPGRLDQLVAGGLPQGITLADNLAKECWEEAGISGELAARAQPVGCVTYTVETEQGFKPDTLYCYDLELPPEFQPRCTDGEVEAFYLWPIERVIETVRETEEFKPNCNLVIIDFLIRRGYIDPDENDYLELVTGLHPSLS